MRPIRFLVPFTFAAGLVACAQNTPVSVMSEDISNTYGPGDFAHEASIAPIPIVVHGRAAGLDHKEMVQAVTSGIQGETWGADTHFVSASSKTDADGDNPYSVVVMINGPSDVTSAQLCAEPATTAGDTPIASNDIHLVAALCRYDSAISGVEARADNIQGVNDPKFQELITEASNQLTAPDPNRRKLM